MIKLTAFASVVALSALVAVPAGAAELRVSSPSAPIVRIAVAGKSAAQLNAEIKSAAENVCAQADGVSVTCVQDAVDDANDQLSALAASHRSVATANLSIERDGPATMRVSLKDKSPEQIEADIREAAAKVCKEDNDGAEFNACVDAAVADAKYQLRTVAQVGSSRELALN